MSIGNVDPTTGRAVAVAGDPNLLLATTYGQGEFGIHLAPVVFARLVASTRPCRPQRLQTAPTPPPACPS